MRDDPGRWGLRLECSCRGQQCTDSAQAVLAAIWAGEDNNNSTRWDVGVWGLGVCEWRGLLCLIRGLEGGDVTDNMSSDWGTRIKEQHRHSCYLALVVTALAGQVRFCDR
jgi:hypothetical protein